MIADGPKVWYCVYWLDPEPSPGRPWSQMKTAAIIADNFEAALACVLAKEPKAKVMKLEHKHHDSLLGQVAC